ncbi:MrcB family domain-containing protein [Furfurilactobacillus siliginis]|uniref:Uncharacterized protein n=1 Tax=Furfurilactobacillus siliginis TaxID=348151 RepID=A0A0R2L666_9LACO|nr:DUF3578 domain-containing protein [Furfurilactobacillus siliginis]KRN97289.1 hypothetical protein IV55_GL000217 [Furfurilactobacillus siliginis]GEK28600.1 hypothetical protein LSI01_09110 [Furfurilactobacillus siliginis]
MLTLKDYLIHVLENYLMESKTPHRNNSLAKYISTEIHTVIPTSIFPTTRYLTKASSGQGNWATIPWVGIFDKKISTSAEGGYDIVYLFKSDYSGVYLSLNQGYTYFKENFPAETRDKNIILTSTYWQNQLQGITRDEDEHFTFDEINLNFHQKTTLLPKGYELGNIYSRYYSLEELKRISSEQLFADLGKMKLLLSDISNSLLFSYNEFNDFIINHNDTNSLKQQIDDESSIYSTDELGTQYDIPTGLSLPKNESSSTHYTHKNYEKNHRKNAKLGLFAEKLVLKKERSLLNSIPELKHLSNKIEHTSVKIGDGTGYDIKSYRLINNRPSEYFIEVKATSDTINTPFYMSKNEINVAANTKNKYAIFRVFKDFQGKWAYYVIDGPFVGSSKIAYIPTQYKVVPKDI